MATVSSLVTALTDFAPDYPRLKILSYVNRAVQEMFRHDCAQALWYNRTDPDHPYPYIDIVDGTLSYDIIEGNLLDNAGHVIDMSLKDSNGNDVPVDCRKIKNVIVFMHHHLGYNPSFYEPIDCSGYNLYYLRGRLHGLTPYRVLCHLTDRSGMHSAQVQFINQPRTEMKYYVEFYYAAPVLTSEQSPCVIDLDVWEEAIICGVQGYLEQVRNGVSAASNQFRQFWIPKFTNSMNSQAADLHPAVLTRRKFG